MRISYVTSVAAHIVTSGTSNASGGAMRGAHTGDDGFAAILGGLVQAPANDKADAAASAVQSDTQADTDSDAASNAAPDLNALLLQSLHPLQEVAPPSGDADSDTSTTLASLTSGAGTQNSATAEPSPAVSTPANMRMARGFKSDPARGAADAVTQAKPAGTPADTTAVDTMLAQMAAAQQAVPAANATPAPADPSTQTTPAVQADPVQAAADAAASPTTDVAAAAILTGGATAKPAKPGTTDDKGASDSEKTQAQGSTAAALADTAASRLFADKQASTAHALPLHTADADAPKNGNQSGTSDQKNPNGNPAAPATAPVADVQAAPAFAPAQAPAHAQAAPQPDASAAVNTAAATTPAASAAANAPAPAAAQLQVAHPATAQPDIHALAFNIATKSEGGARHFDIRMDPAELGRVDVRLTVDDAGKAQATLSVEKPQTLALLQKDSSHLERALKDAGLDLSQNGLNFSLKGQQQQAGNGGNGHASSSRGRQLAVQAIVAADAAASHLSLSGAGASDTRLDIRV